MNVLQHINKFFVAVIIISCFTYFERADYNLPLFVFVLFLWNHNKPSQKIRLWWMIVISEIVDIIWIAFWGALWNGDDFRRFNNTGVVTFTLVMAIINLLIKLVIIIILFVTQNECKRGVTNFFPNLKSVFVYTPESPNS